MRAWLPQDPRGFEPQRPHCQRHAAVIEIAIEENAGSESAPLSEPAQFNALKHGIFAINPTIPGEDV
jgi:hypothetical protein